MKKLAPASCQQLIWNWKGAAEMLIHPPKNRQARNDLFIAGYRRSRFFPEASYVKLAQRVKEIRRLIRSRDWSRGSGMPTNVRIKLTSTDLDKVERVCFEIRDIALKTGTKIRGPIPLPKRRLVLPVRKSPCGEGTHTWRKHELRVHRRLIDLFITDQRVMRQIMRIQIPEGVSVEMTVK